MDVLLFDCLSIPGIGHKTKNQMFPSIQNFKTYSYVWLCNSRHRLAHFFALGKKKSHWDRPGERILVTEINISEVVVGKLALHHPALIPKLA